MQLTNKTQAYPFLKWAGGKGRVINQLMALAPQGLFSGEIRKYAEPFYSKKFGLSAASAVTKSVPHG